VDWEYFDEYMKKKYYIPLVLGRMSIQFFAVVLAANLFGYDILSLLGTGMRAGLCVLMLSFFGIYLYCRYMRFYERSVAKFDRLLCNGYDIWYIQTDINFFTGRPTKKETAYRLDAIDSVKLSFEYFIFTGKFSVAATDGKQAYKIDTVCIPIYFKELYAVAKSLQKNSGTRIFVGEM
jgi:hypothetical protein